MRENRPNLTLHHNRSPQTAPSSDRPAPRRLDSWKEIAAYLGRGVRTVQRWEREEGLPVHRLAHEKRGSVFAHRDELDAWWEARRRSLVTTPKTELEELPISRRPERVTYTSAVTFWPALSSDARMLAYVSDGGRDGAMPQIWVQQVGGTPVCITSGRREYANLSFATRDTRLVFTAKGETGPSVYEMPALGGEPRLLKRAATDGRISPDGRWLAYVSYEPAGELRIAALDATGERRIGPGLTDVSSPVWSPDGRHVLVHAHPDPTVESDYWIAPRDGGAAVNTGVVQKLREHRHWLVAMPPAWVRDSLLFSAVGPDGINIWRQRLAQGTLQATGEPERLTGGTELDWSPTAAAGRLAFVSVHPDLNLWSVAIEPVTGAATGPLRRMTRGPGIVAHLTVTDDGRTLAYFEARMGRGNIMLRELARGTDQVFASEPPNADRGYPAISPSGSQLAFGVRVPGPTLVRPIFVASIPDGSTRELCEDCGGRPRQWVDERLLVVERFGSLFNSLELLNTTTGTHVPLLASADRSITNPRLSPDRRWIAFDATHPGGFPSVFVAPMGAGTPIPELDWVLVERSASHPFWSADGRVLYYLPTIPSADMRSAVWARRCNVGSGLPDGERFTAFTSNDMIVPTTKGVPGTAPVATTDQIIFAFGDGRGDIWMMDLEQS